jgi:PAS domain-containing protein
MFQEILNNGFLLGALTGASTSADALWANLTNSLFLIVGFAALFLAIYVYKKDPHGELNKSFFYFGMFIFFWVGITGFLSSYTQNIFWLRLSSGAGAMVALSGLFFCCLLAQKKISRLLRILLIIMCGLMVYLTTFTSFFIEKLLSYSTTGFQIVLGPLYSVWAIHQLVMVAAIFYVLFSSLRHAEGKRKKQILYFILGIAIAAGWNMLVSVILPFFNYSGLSNIDSPAAIILVGFTSYSIIKYNLMDISSLFFKAFIYSLVIVAIIAFLLLLVFVSSFFFEQLLVWPIYVMVAIVSIALFFIGRLFFTEKRDLEEAKVNLTESLQKSEEDRRKAEIERDKTATIISSFSDGLIIIDEKGEISSINPRAENILELKRE